MKKKELKNGYRVQLRDGSTGTVIDLSEYGCENIITFGSINLTFSKFDENLNFIGNHYNDIIKVYKPLLTNCNGGCISGYELTWKRVDPIITENEYAILLELNKQYKYIGRTNDGFLYLSITKKETGVSTATLFDLFEFRGIEKNTEYSISELLEEFDDD